MILDQFLVLLPIIGFILLIGLVVVLFATPALLRGAPYVVTANERLEHAFDLVHIQPGDRVVDLGSGDGRIVLAAARHGATAIGFETNPWLVWKSRALLARAGVTNRATIRLGNLWQAPIGDADVIFLYLFPNYMDAIGKKFLKETKPGTRIVTFGWPIPGWQTHAERDRIYLYTIASHVQG